jgi:ABC-2 type transport system ATP-binding protein
VAGADRPGPPVHQPGCRTTTGTTVILTTHYIDEADHLANRLILLVGGRVRADTTPAGLRSQAGPATIRYRPPDGLPGDDLPPSLAPYLNPATRTLIVPADNPAGPLRDLLHWADRHHLDLAGVQIEQPSLEDAYLAALGGPAAPKANPS